MIKVLLNRRLISSSKVKGFTLIELLVVISIISLLAAILFPVFARARENARRATCMSNLKQISLGMMMYVQDNDERLPNYTYNPGFPPGPENGNEWYPSSTSTYWFWMNMIFPYVKSVQVFICPSSPLAGTDYGAPSSYYGPYMQHYAVNTGVGQNLFPTGRWGTSGKKTTVIDAPASTYLIMESSYYVVSNEFADGPVTSNNYYLPGICTIYPTSTVTHDDCWGGRHFAGVNVAFADGHVKWLKTQTLAAEALKPNHGNWNPDRS